MAVPNWSEFKDMIESLYKEVKSTVTGGANATYIPVLAEAVSGKRKRGLPPRRIGRFFGFRGGRFFVVVKVVAGWLRVLVLFEVRRR